VIRVIYRWTVDAAETETFVDAWSAATERIRAEQPGAMGSTLLRPSDTENRFVAVARWRQREDVEAFWAQGSASAKPLLGGTLESVEILEEIAHMTLEAAS
jgi:heme-degrading monooxygenase HmoA